MVPTKRTAAIHAALKIYREDIPHIPLHHQIAVWALKRPLTYAARTDEFTFAHDIK